MRNDSVMLKYAYRILMVVPFAIPVCMGLLEEKYGRIVWLSYVWVSIFIMSLIVLYVWGVVSAVRCRTRADVLYELLLLHLVKIPLFIVAWIICMIVYVIFFNSCLWTRWYSMRCTSPRPATFAHIL